MHFSSFLAMITITTGHFRVFIFTHRAYSKTWNPHKISISSFFKVLWLFNWFQELFWSFCMSRRNHQSVAQGHQRELTLKAWKWLFLLLKPKWYLSIKLEAFYQFSSNDDRKQWVLFYLESFLLISGISGFSFFVIEHIGKPRNHGKFSEAHF